MLDLGHILEFLHVFSVIAWMVGMFYLPRLYVYHVGLEIGSEADKMLRVMERRLLKVIMTPAMVAVFFFGLLIAYLQNSFDGMGWLHLKFILVLFLAGLHGFFLKCRKDFAVGVNKRSATFFKILNELVTVIVLAIVFLACTKPF